MSESRNGAEAAQSSRSPVGPRCRPKACEPQVGLRVGEGLMGYGPEDRQNGEPRANPKDSKMAWRARRIRPLLAIAGATCLSSCSLGSHDDTVRDVKLEPGTSHRISELFPAATKVCILRDWLSFNDYVNDGIAYQDPRELNRYRSCPQLNVNNPEGENWIVVLKAGQCPFIASTSKSMTENGRPFSGNCVDPRAVLHVNRYNLVLDRQGDKP